MVRDRGSKGMDGCPLTGVVIRQAGKGVEGSTIDSHKDGRGEVRTMIEFDPMSIVVI
jgi:hypothetical protein